MSAEFDVVIALDVHRILRCHRESAIVSNTVIDNRSGTQRYIAERSIHEFQDVAGPADPILTRGCAATVNSITAAARNRAIGIRFARSRALI